MSENQLLHPQEESPKSEPANEPEKQQAQAAEQTEQQPYAEALQLHAIPAAGQNSLSEPDQEIRIVENVEKKRPQAKPLNDEQLAAGLKTLKPYLQEAIAGREEELPRGLLEALVAKAPVPRKAMLHYHIPFNQHQKRELAVEAMYQHLLLNRDIRQCLYNVLCQTNQADDLLYELTVGTAAHEGRLREEISAHLRDDWTWDRLSALEQAILLVEAHEMEALDLPRQVVINEAVTLAKEYCDPSAPALVNAILDRMA